MAGAGAVRAPDPGAAAVAAPPGAADGGRRTPGATDRRHPVGRADDPFPARPQRGPPAADGQRDRRRQPVRPAPAGAHGLPRAQPSRARPHRLARWRRRAGGIQRRGPVRAGRALGAVAPGARARPRDPHAAIQPARASAGPRVAHPDGLSHPAVCRRPIPGRRDRHLFGGRHPRADGPVVVRPGQRDHAGRPARARARRARGGRAGKGRVHALARPAPALCRHRAAHRQRQGRPAVPAQPAGRLRDRPVARPALEPRGAVARHQSPGGRRGRAARAGRLPDGDGGFPGDRLARLRPGRPGHLRQSRVLPHGRHAGRGADRALGADAVLGAGGDGRVSDALHAAHGRDGEFEGLRDDFPAQRRYALSGAHLRVAAGGRERQADGLDGIHPRHLRPQAFRGTEPAPAGKAPGQRAAGHHGRNRVHPRP